MSDMILIVDDEITTSQLVKMVLKKQGYRVVIATNGPEALRMADDLIPDLILLDIRLPYEDGYGALKKIRQSERLKEIPVIAVTAEAGVEQMNRARSAGFNGFLGKPLDPDKFPDQIRRILNGEGVWEIPFEGLNL